MLGMDINANKHNPEHQEKLRVELKEKAFEIYKGMVINGHYANTTTKDAYEAAETFLNYTHKNDSK